MGRIEETARLPAAPADVWAVAADPARFGEWLRMHRSWQGDPPSQFAAGDQVTAVVSLLNLPTTITWTVEEYEAPTRVRFAGKGLANIDISIELDVTADGSDASAVTVIAEFAGQLLTGPIEQAVETAARAEVHSSIARLTELVG
ncbi:SRPBCC family protein [uncultured Jatrophihabitans sp.]|uniref:type II toxin-antitoxin system Rv0910 family toxin n=1 Tax=uncultured Jatrophihabitans sp. TaxID=1610747 RepID=UPI0035CA92DC